MVSSCVMLQMLMIQQLKQIVIQLGRKNGVDGKDGGIIHKPQTRFTHSTPQVEVI